jgi:hypothetical protein
MGLFDIFTKKKDKGVEVSVVSKENKEEKFDFSISLGNDAPPPLEELLKDAIPSKNGLYPHEILMLDYANTYKVSGDNHFQGFWLYQYSVKEPQTVLKSLYDRGFITEGGLQETLNRLTLPVLKEELKSLGLKVSGKKSDLVDRLLESDAVASLEDKYSKEKLYKPTDMGKQELEDNAYVHYIHRKNYLSIWELNKMLADKPGYSYRDVLWGYFNEQSIVHFKKYNFGLYRNTRLDMYEFLMEESKHKAAFSLLCEVISYDLSGLHNNEDFMFRCEKDDLETYCRFYEMRLESSFPYGKSGLFLAPAVIQWLGDMQGILGLSDDEFKVALLNEISNVNPPRRVFTSEEIVDIVLAGISNDEETLTEIFAIAEQRERAKLEELKSRLK